MRLIKLAFLCASILLWALPGHAQNISGRASIIDADTLEIRSQRIRLHGVDAPESRQECKQAGKTVRCGQQAALKLAEKIGQQTVSCEQKDIDRYGRIVAVCRAGALDLNGWLVSEGLALAYRAYSADYVGQEQDAKLHKRYLWGMEFVAPWDWRRGERLPTANNSAPSRRHPAGAFVDKDCGDFSSRAEAQAFFEAAGPGDPHRLDRDGDGMACESLR
jgi:endonuclease YncB( thermonuclease family)